MTASNKCCICKQSCWDRQLLVKCAICDSKLHFKCLNGNISSSNDVSQYQIFFCSECTSCILPFQNLNNDNFSEELDHISVERFLNSANSKNSDFEPDTDNVRPDKYYFSDEFSFSVERNPGELTILHVNIVSLNRNFSKLEELLCQMQTAPDVICVSETRLKNYHDNAYIPSIIGYEFYRKDSNTAAGGVGIYVNSDFDVTERNDLNLNQNDCEDLWIQIKISEYKPVVVASIYRHPRHNFENFQYALLHSVEKLNQHNTTYYLLGDFNLNLLLHDRNDKIKHYVDLLNCYDCRYILTKPTRINRNHLSRSSLIDHIYTNDCKNELTPGILVTDTSDHFPITLKVDLKIRRNVFTSRRCRDYKNLNQENFITDLKNKLTWWIDRLTINPDFDVNATFNLLLKLIKETVDKHAPFRNLSRKELRKMIKPWLTRGILISIKNRQKYYTEGILNPQLWERYTKYRNMLKQIITKSKINVNRKRIMLSNNKSRAMWDIINKSLNKKPK